MKKTVLLFLAAALFAGTSCGQQKTTPQEATQAAAPAEAAYKVKTIAPTVTGDAIKPELMKRGVQFVYVTGETSPEATWTEMIKGIDGDHYRLTKAQWDELCTRLQIPGIPSYMLLGKDGSVAYSNLTEGGYPGNDIIKAEIEKALQ